MLFLPRTKVDVMFMTVEWKTYKVFNMQQDDAWNVIFLYTRNKIF